MKIQFTPPISFLLFLLISLFISSGVSKAIVIGVHGTTIEAYDESNWSTISSATLTMNGFTIVNSPSVTWNSDDLLYYIILHTPGGTVGAESQLATVDPISGVCTFIGYLGSDYQSLTYNSTASVMYAMQGDENIVVAQRTRLSSVNLSNAATTTIGNFGYSEGCHIIAFNYDDNLVYLWSGDDDLAGYSLLKINPNTSAQTGVIQTGFQMKFMSGAVYRGGNVFIANGRSVSLTNCGLTVTSAGVVSFVANSATLVYGLAYRDPLLPVELTSFTSEVSDNSVLLKWTTSKETNNKGFEVERSSGNNSWNKIAFVNGNGNSEHHINYSFNNKNLSSGSYSYRLKQIDFNGNFEFHDLNNEVFIGVPEKFELLQNYPNPFNPNTSIEYRLPLDGFVNIIIYDYMGREVSSLLNEYKTAGFHSVNFNAGSIPSGTYFYKIIFNGESAVFSTVKKMMVIK
ncbi:MAG TPA: T9SS type A sorting domain-containing protein [Ignavibacteria bacterium]|nr:T9SS type A sorting domain-containing protein [Ignavibacteria bacterium]HMR42124.1 T9SS type A sorting domain-containing protein [Ignavibacteria bacterium]